MGSTYQLLTPAPVALAILAALLLVALIVGRFFRDKKTRKRIMLGAIGIYLLAVLAYIGFIALILSGDLN
jgi:hypothetical protein